ncbi:hypothetical protein GCQ56_15490 [Marinifilum sp. N1E240]|uniref:hypothetical protein n=1 Tax=Marinifilum sp. N1E240 TaxID=2608082 RepID=UPI00128E8377|nr:hypothetical protein [Marinifilum sp. N1E240]MPQ48407.1 hypothetical protein [Marinifilum sp. N1E240]
MRKKYKSLGIVLVVLGLLSMLLLLVKASDFYEMEGRYLFASLVFLGTLLPAVGFRLIRRK